MENREYLQYLHDFAAKTKSFTDNFMAQTIANLQKNMTPDEAVKMKKQLEATQAEINLKKSCENMNDINAMVNDIKQHIYKG